MDNQLILAIEEEETNLELHVKLCEQRYRQLTTKLDHVDTRLERLESHIVDIKDAIKNTDNSKYKTYLVWAGAAISLLVTASASIIAHLLTKLH